MDSGTSKILSKVLNRRELDKIPSESATKIEKYFDERFEDFLTSQALHESSQRDHGKQIFGNSHEKCADTGKRLPAHCRMPMATAFFVCASAASFSQI